MRLSDLAIAPIDALNAARAYLADVATPSLRLGVTGLARAGKTVFITALVRNLLEGGRLPFLAVHAERRLLERYLEPQPDDDVPRFDYERHLAALTAPDPVWPDSTRAISELRLTLVYQPVGQLARALGPRKLHVDIVDYPGEWLLDLAMLNQSYAQWSAESIALARQPQRRAAAQAWLDTLADLDPGAPADEAQAIAATSVFTAYLRAARDAEPALSTVGPGRFLLPGEREGSPLLQFVPLDVTPDQPLTHGTLAAMMARRYNSYCTHVVRPFFQNHFSKLDRQIVLVDVLTALNHGAFALAELSRALQAALIAFRPGRRSWLSVLLGARIDKIVFAATKADHLPQTSHDRLESVLSLIVDDARRRAETAGADIKAVALAALRATTQVEVYDQGEVLICIKGTPLPGERLGARTFDGSTEVAVFPGDLEEDPRATLEAARTKGVSHQDQDVDVVRFRPPPLVAKPGQTGPVPWPHIRLDRALEHLLGDRLI